jgi:hypothetical protein
MKESPILFNSTMVKEIIAERKTMTRRVTKIEFGDYDEVIKQCNFGGCGDLLWVRESHCVHTKPDNHFEIRYSDNESIIIKPSESVREKLNGRKTLDTGIFITGRYLPKELSRLSLINTKIVWHRLWGIRDEDCEKEGIHFDDDSGYWFAGDLAMGTSPFDCFRSLWTEVNGLESWDANPFVFGIEFKIHKLKQ